MYSVLFLLKKIGPILFTETVNTNVNLEVYNKFFTLLTPNKEHFAHFQQNGATYHTTGLSLTCIPILHKKGTSARVCDCPALPTCYHDYFLWGFLKGVYHKNPRALEILKNNIHEEIYNILKVY